MAYWTGQNRREKFKTIPVTADDGKGTRRSRRRTIESCNNRRFTLNVMHQNIVLSLHTGFNQTCFRLNPYSLHSHVNLLSFALTRCPKRTLINCLIRCIYSYLPVTFVVIVTVVHFSVDQPVHVLQR